MQKLLPCPHHYLVHKRSTRPKAEVAEPMSVPMGSTGKGVLRLSPSQFDVEQVDLSRHRRRARSLPKIQGSRGGIWIDTCQVSVGRDRPNRRNITAWRRDDAKMLYEAAQSMLVRSAKWSWLKAWAIKIARHRGMKKAIVALARRLAVIMHRIWVDGTEFRWTGEQAAAA